jgi:phage shock protein C
MEDAMEKRLYRSKRSRVFGGVAGGLGEYFNIDPVIMRVIFVIVTLMHGLGILAYIIMWIVIPEEPFELAYPINNETTGENKNADDNINNIPAAPKKSTGSLVFGVILIAIGFLFLADRFIPRFSFDDFFPVVIIAIGGFLVLNSLKNRGVK